MEHVSIEDVANWMGSACEKRPLGRALGTDDVAVHAVVDEREVFETINALKEVGASDVLVTEIERLVE
jgi:ATP phosphoribosyltransferase-like protein